MLIRYATLEDLSQCHNFLKEIRMLKTNNPDSLITYMHEKIVNNEMLIAYDMILNVCMGFISFSRNDNKISCLAVKPVFQQLGIGAILVEHAIDELDKTKSIIAISHAHDKNNQMRIIKLYEKYNFKFLEPSNSVDFHDHELVFEREPSEFKVGETLREIHQRDFGLPDFCDDDKFTQTRSICALIKNQNNEIALIQFTDKNYYELPSLPHEEEHLSIKSIEQGLKKKYGLQVEFLAARGKIIEYRDSLEEIQITFSAEFNFTHHKKTNKSRTKNSSDVRWVSVEEAIHFIESNSCDKYLEKYVRERDLTFLRHL